jgi:hypothetical protein
VLSNNALSQHTYKATFLQINILNVVCRLNLDKYIHGIRPTVAVFVSQHVLYISTS